MGTNYYLHKLPTEAQITELKNLIDLSKTGEHFSDIRNLVREMYDEPDIAGQEEFAKLHLGKRSCGWKFDWCPNLIKEWNPDKQEFDYKLRYQLTHQGITDFIMNENFIVVDEYGEVQDKKEFLEMAFNWCLDGWDSMHNDDPSDIPYDWSKDQQKFKDLGIEFKAARQSDFISDGLRFNIWDDFC